VFRPYYQQLQAVVASKPAMIGEVGCAEAGGSKAAWIGDALSVQLPGCFPGLRALCWFNVDLSGSGQADWRIESSPAAQAAFAGAAASATYSGKAS
jgi:mannan endo-1,4-beta-mannosidase